MMLAFYIQLYSPASIPTFASVYILEFLVVCNAIIYKEVCSLLRLNKEHLKIKG
jgi:hypothetical protein